MNLRIRIRSSKDFLAGLLFAAIGLFAVIVASQYPMGAARNIGPGYFPVLLGGVLVLLGCAIGAKGLALSAEPVDGWALRPLLLVTAAVVAFALLARPLGLAIATIVLVVVSSLASRDFSLSRVILLSLGLVVLSAAIFIYALGLPFQLWPR